MDFVLAYGTGLSLSISWGNFCFLIKALSKNKLLCLDCSSVDRDLICGGKRPLRAWPYVRLARASFQPSASHAAGSPSSVPHGDVKTPVLSCFVHVCVSHTFGSLRVQLFLSVL